MSTPQTAQLTASSVRTLYWSLVGGLLAIMGVFAFLFSRHLAPTMAADPSATTVIGPVMAALAFGSLASGWLWARPKLLRPAPGATPDAYWGDPNAGARAMLLWVLWEGGSIVATVGSLLTGSVFVEGVAALGLGLLLTHSPGFIESRFE
jgi:hypothetical protein